MCTKHYGAMQRVRAGLAEACAALHRERAGDVEETSSDAMAPALVLALAQRIRFTSGGPPPQCVDPRQRAYYRYPFPGAEQWNMSALRRAATAATQQTANAAAAERDEKEDEDEKKKDKSAAAADAADGGGGEKRKRSPAANELAGMEIQEKQPAKKQKEEEERGMRRDATLDLMLDLNPELDGLGDNVEYGGGVDDFDDDFSSDESD